MKKILICVLIIFAFCCFMPKPDSVYQNSNSFNPYEGCQTSVDFIKMYVSCEIPKTLEKKWKDDAAYIYNQDYVKQKQYFDKQKSNYVEQFESWAEFSPDSPKNKKESKNPP